MSESQKKHLAKIVRVQLGNYEQAILLYNSLCSLGKAWSEIGKDSKCLLERYELIKNHQEGFIQGVDFKKRYPKIEYEET